MEDGKCLLFGMLYVPLGTHIVSTVPTIDCFAVLLNSPIYSDIVCVLAHNCYLLDFVCKHKSSVLVSQFRFNLCVRQPNCIQTVVYKCMYVYTIREWVESEPANQSGLVPSKWCLFASVSIVSKSITGEWTKTNVGSPIVVVVGPGCFFPSPHNPLMNCFTQRTSQRSVPFGICCCSCCCCWIVCVHVLVCHRFSFDSCLLMLMPSLLNAINYGISLVMEVMETISISIHF